MEFIDGCTLMYLLKNISEITIEELAKNLDVSVTTVNRYLNGKGRPKFPTALTQDMVRNTFNKLRNDSYRNNSDGFVTDLLNFLRNDLKVPAIANEFQELYLKKLQDGGEEIACGIILDDLFIKCKKKYTVVIQNNIEDSDNLKNEDVTIVLSSAQKICEKAILMKYGHRGIDTDYLSRLCVREKITGMKDVYYDLSDFVSDYSRVALNNLYGREIRLLLSGDVYIGRTTQLLNYCKRALDENNIVFYISPPALKNKEIFTYIYESFLKDISCLNKYDAKTAFKMFKNFAKNKNKVTIVIDGYDYIDKQQRNSLDNILKYEDSLISDVNVIIKVRFRDVSWPQNYVEVMAKGVSNDVIRKEISIKKIDFSQIQPIVTSLQSPWLLKMLINDITSNVENIINPGRLIQQSIANRVETMSHIGIVDLEVLRFSVHALLPQLVKDNVFLKTYLYDTLPKAVGETIEQGFIPECFEVEDFLYKLNGSRNKIFNEFFKIPIVDTMDLMKEDISHDRTKSSYEWKDHTVRNYFSAVAILTLFRSHNQDEAKILINKVADGLLQLDRTLIDADIDQTVFTSFDIARYLMDLTDDENIDKMHDIWTEQMVVLYSGMAMVYEIFGKEEERFCEAMRSLALIDNLYMSEYPDRQFIAHWFNKMSYYVIKCSGKTIDNFQSSVHQAKKYLEYAIKIVEEEYEILSNNSRFELSEMYGNMGAYYLRQKKYDNAMEWHQKSLLEKEKCLKQCEGDERKTIQEGLRRSLVSFATDAFYMGDYDKSIEYHDKAIEIGAQTNSRFRYESYSRKVGSYIELLNEQSCWSLEWGGKLLDLLIEDIDIMGEYINRDEMDAILSIAERILSALTKNGVVSQGDFPISIQEKACLIEERYNYVTWSNINRLSKFFKEVK